MVKPGDKTGEMMFSNDDQFLSEIGLGMYCDFDNSKNIDPNTSEFECEAVQGDRVFLNCLGWYGDSIEELDSNWGKSTWKLMVDDQIVDLPSFGTFELDAQDDNPMARTWKVVLENVQSGTHTVICEEVVEGEQTVYRFKFIVSEQATTYPPLPSTPIPGQHPYSSEISGLDYQLYIPEDYGKKPSQEWPLVLFLHGYSKGLPNIDAIKRESLPLLLEDEVDFPFIVVSPHRDEGYFEYWQQDKNINPMFVLLEEIQTLHSVDLERIYLSGESGGGNGVWEIGLQYPERFAALVPVSGYYGYPFEVPDNICDLKDVPIWAFHGEIDETVPLEAEQSLVEALEACGGNVQFTVFPDTGHNLDAELVYTTDLSTWLLSQTLKSDD